MEYKGKFKIFNQKGIKTYPAEERFSKVVIGDIIKPSDIEELAIKIPEDIRNKIAILADHIIKAREKSKPVVVFSGAHLIKNGLSALLIDLFKYKIFTLISGNGATAIHDFELGLFGKTSEEVGQSLPVGKFGMANELNLINTGINWGNKYKYGFGETLGKIIFDKKIFKKVYSKINSRDKVVEFLYPEISILANAYKYKIPCTIHVGIGSDVIDQHQDFNGESKGGCSGRDFLVFVEEITRMSGGGVFLNIGSAVTGPEVFLKAVSMASNIGKPPLKLITANFDLKDFKNLEEIDESSQYYYYRDQKSVLERIPKAFNGESIYIKGNQINTFPILYKELIKRIK
jgi:hypothetical protein